MINLKNYKIYYEPYPHIIFKNILDTTFYNDLCKEFPLNENFSSFNFDKKRNEQKQNKLSIANNNKNFTKIIYSRKNTKLFFDYITSQLFREEIINFLNINHIKLNYNLNKSIIEKIYRKIKKKIDYTFEFSLISSDGGYINAHTDGPEKLISLIFPMVDDKRILNIKNSGTKILFSKNEKFKYNIMNYVVPFEDTEMVREIPFNENQLCIFIKTHNSLHSVGPMEKYNKETIMRKSINFNIYS